MLLRRDGEGESVMSSWRDTRWWTAGRVRLTAPLALPLLLGSVLTAAPQPSGATLPQGAEISATGCTYGPGQLVAGHRNGEYFADTTGFFALTFLPANAPGGHFIFRAEYPRARWFSYQAFDDTAATQGVVDDLHINPDPGSVNPFLPGKQYESGHVSYTVNVQNVPPSQRQNPPPPNVLYAGYRKNPDILGMTHTPDEMVLYNTELATGPGQQGGVPLPSLYWVVDNPAQNPFQTQAQLCAALKAAAQPWAPLFQLNATLNEYVWTPVLSPALKNINLPNPLDPIPLNPPDVSVFRPSSSGYSLPLFNEQTPFIFSGPSALFGRFIVIRFKAPTSPRVEQGIPSTGNEQTQFWNWCAGQSWYQSVSLRAACPTWPRTPTLPAMSRSWSLRPVSVQSLMASPTRTGLSGPGAARPSG